MNSRRWRSLAWAAALFVSAAGSARSDAIERERLLSDFDLLVSVLESHHPRFGHYRDTADLRRDLAAARARIDRDLTAMDFYGIAAVAAAAVADGHTGVSAPADRPVLPLELFIDSDGRGWIRQRNAEDVPPEGSEVLAIQGRPMREILQRLKPALPRDWSLASGRRARLSDSFSRYYAEIIGSSNRYQIHYRNGTESGVITLDAISAAEADRLRPRSRDQVPIEWRMLDDDIARITLRSFNNANFQAQDLEFDRSVADAMAFVRDQGARALILDIRANGGGQARNGAHLSRYFLRQRFQYLESVTAVADRLPAIEHSQWAESDEASQSEFAAYLESAGDGRFRVATDWYPVDPVEPMDWTFDGELFVLIDGGVSSTGSDFAATMHAHERARFIGEMMGGSYDGNASGLTARIRLPETGVTLYLPLFDFKLSAGTPPDPRGAFVPDQELPVWHPVMGGDDPILARALELARQ